MVEVTFLSETALLSSRQNPNVTIRRKVGYVTEHPDTIVMSSDAEDTEAALIYPASRLRQLVKTARSGQYIMVEIDGGEWCWLNPEHVLRMAAGGPFPIK